MRVMVAVVLLAVLTVIGFTALSQQAQDVKPTLNDSTANETYGVATNVFEGTGGALAILVPWGGIIAVIAVVLGLLVAASQGGGR